MQFSLSVPVVAVLISTFLSLTESSFVDTALRNPHGFRRFREEFERNRGTAEFKNWRWMDFNGDGELTLDDFKAADKSDVEDALPAKKPAIPRPTATTPKLPRPRVFSNFASKAHRLLSNSVHY